MLEDAEKFSGFERLFDYLKLEGILIICNSSSFIYEKLKLKMKFSGFVHVNLLQSSTTKASLDLASYPTLLLDTYPNGVVIGSKPSYEVGTSVKLQWDTSTPFNTNPNKETTKVTAVWKIEAEDMDFVKGNDDLIDEDNLLDDEDKRKPDPNTLKGIIHYSVAYLD